MGLSIYTDKLKCPDEKSLEESLGKNYGLWREIRAFVFEEYPGAKDEWKYSGINYGWGYRLKDKKRVIVYLTPCMEYFLVSLVFGEKAVKETLNSKISSEIKEIINSAKVYAEGRGFRLDVKNKKILKDVKSLIRIKLHY